MAFMEVRDGAGAQMYLKTFGTGGSTQPFISVFLPYALTTEYVSGYTTNITGSTSHAVIAAQSTNVKLYITSITAHNSSTEITTWVNIYDGTSSGTIKFSGFCPTLNGFSVTLPVPIVGSANTALSAVCESTSANVRVSASGFIST